VENKGQFRKALFGGFNQEDVLKYIELLQRQVSAPVPAAVDTSVYTQEIARLTQQNTALLAQVNAQKNTSLESESALRAQAEELTARLNAAVQSAAQHVAPPPDDGEKEQLRAYADKAEQELRTALQQGEKLRRDRDAQEARGRGLEQEIAQLRAEMEQMRSQPDRMDEVSAQLGKIFVDTKRQADTLLEQSRLEAAGIERSAVSHADRVVSELTETEGDLRAIKAQIESLYNRFAGRIDTLSEDLSEARQELCRKKSLWDTQASAGSVEKEVVSLMKTAEENAARVQSDFGVSSYKPDATLKIRLADHSDRLAE